MSSRFLRRADELSFSLCQGDIDAHLDRLCENEEPEEPVSAKIRRLLVVYKYNAAINNNALLLLQQSPWHTGAAEQQHASAALVGNFHPEVEQDALMVRAALHTFRRLLPDSSPEEKLVARLLTKLDRLERREPQKSGHDRSCARAPSRPRRCGRWVVAGIADQPRS